MHSSCLHIVRILHQLFDVAFELVRETAAEGELALEVGASLLVLAPLALPAISGSRFSALGSRGIGPWPSRPTSSSPSTAALFGDCYRDCPARAPEDPFDLTTAMGSLSHKLLLMMRSFNAERL